MTRVCAVRRTGPFSRAGVSGAPRRAGTAVRNGSDSDVIYYLNQTRLPVIGTESLTSATPKMATHRRDGPHRHVVLKTQSLRWAGMYQTLLFVNPRNLRI